MLFQTYNHNTQKNDSLNSPLTHLEDFYVAYAKVKNGAIDAYATNSKEWFPEFLKLWGNDPIVSQSYAQTSHLRIGEWNFKSSDQRHHSYIQHRASLTGAHQGFTAFKSTQIEENTYSEFYALGFSNNQNALEKMFNRDFTMASLSHIVNFFNTNTHKV